MKYALWFLLISNVFLMKTALCQTKEEFTDIPYVKISDSVLISNIDKIIDLQVNSSDTSNLFKKGFGYVSLLVFKYPNNKDTSIIYYINTELFGFKKETSDWSYSDYYSYVNNKLVLVTIGPLRSFAETKHSEKSKKLIRKLVDKCLVKTQKLTFYNMDGTKAFTDKHFRQDVITFHGGYYLYIFRKKKPPELKKDIGGKEF